MTKSELLQYTKRLTEINKSKLPSDLRDRRLAALMNDLEIKYDIPMLRNEKFEKENQMLMVLYRTISSTRSLKNPLTAISE